MAVATTTIKISDRYWDRIWATHERDLLGSLSRAVRSTKVKVLAVALVILFFFSVPLPLPFDGGTRMLSLAEFLTFDGYYIDVKMSGNPSASPPVPALFTPEEYLLLVCFIWKWFGYAAFACMAYWAFFISPYDKLKGKNPRAYVQDVVFENPASPGTFLKSSFDLQRHRWIGFVYTWCMGVIACMIVQNDQWTWMHERQHYWLAAVPAYGIVPVALLFSMIVNVAAGLAIGTARPATAAGRRKKVTALAIIGACTFLTILLAVANAGIMQDYFENWNTYSIRYPEDPLDPAPEYFVNYTVLFWALGLGLSVGIGILFPVVCTLYQNLKIRNVVGKYHGTILGEDDTPWEPRELAAKHDADDRLRRRIKVMSAFELAFFFGLFLVAFWGIMYEWGSKVGNQTMEYIGYGILGFEVIWAIVLSPIVHYKAERRVLYQGRSLGFVATEDRGIGSWKHYWKLWNVKNKLQFNSPEERKELLPVRRFMIVLTGIMALWICGLGMWEQGTVGGLFETIFKAIGQGSAAPSAATITGVFAIGYMFVAPVLFLYALSILKFNDVKDPERGKKRVYSLFFLVLAAGLVIGIADVFNRFGAEVAGLFAAPPAGLEWVVLVSTVVPALLLLVLNLLAFPFFVRIKDLYKSIPDLLLIMAFGVVFLSVWNYLSEWLLTLPSLHWSWRHTRLDGGVQVPNPSEDPIFLRDSFVLGQFFTRVSGYFYWGWVQELLFLGYFCWLLYKVTPNKFINATISSLLFMMFHWDNIALMIGTAVGGFAWAIFWAERRNLFMLGWMHGFNGSLVDTLIPMSMSVGPMAR